MTCNAQPKDQCEGQLNIFSSLEEQGPKRRPVITVPAPVVGADEEWPRNYPPRKRRKQ